MILETRGCDRLTLGGCCGEPRHLLVKVGIRRTHFARDVSYAIDNGDDFLPMRLKLWLHKGFGLAKDISPSRTIQIIARRRALEQTISDILAASTSCDLAKALHNKFMPARDQLLTFAHWSGQVEETNNVCERDLRPAVIKRKITNGYRAMRATLVRTFLRWRVASPTV